MIFPKIQVCIVCEAIRQEAGGKLSILGFSGVLPTLEMPTSKKPRTLTFLLIADPMAGGTFGLSATLENPDKSLAAPPQNGQLTFEPIPRERGTFLATSFNDLTISQEGTYTFRLTVDEELVLTQTFQAFHPAQTA